MATPRLLFPEQVRAKLARRYKTNHRDWLAGDGVWPIMIPLGAPKEKDAQDRLDLVSEWAAAWRDWRGPGALTWRERHWKAMGVQRLPGSLALANANEVAAWVGEDGRWRRAAARHDRLVAQWPKLREAAVRHFDVLADYDEADFERLRVLLAWLAANPRSNLYPRQLPVPGLDSKWLERRAGLLLNLLNAIQGADTVEARDLYQRCGLRAVPRLVRVRLLDPGLRLCAGGMGDLSAPVEELARLRMPVRCAFIVENLQTGLAFEELPGAVVLMGLGYDVKTLGRIPWLEGAHCVYWGDLDTHGFAILNRARAHLPGIASCLMDEGVLLRHKPFWSEEPRQHAAMTLPRLTDAEHAVYHGLKSHRWGHNVRLEQERIEWAHAWETIRRLRAAATGTPQPTQCSGSSNPR